MISKILGDNITVIVLYLMVVLGDHLILVIKEISSNIQCS